jgi:hypothetical protein
MKHSQTATSGRDIAPFAGWPIGAHIRLVLFNN